MQKTLFLVLCGFLLFGCSKNTDSIDWIDYEELKEIKIELDIQISESSDFLPGSLRDLIVFSDGSMVVSDWGSNSIEQFDSMGNHMATVAERGRGPGELSNFFLLFDGGSDTLIVRHRGMNQQIDLFTRNSENNIFTHSSSMVIEEFSDRHVTLLEKRSASEYYALAPHVTRSFNEASMEYPNYAFSPVVIADEFERVLQDSLHLLKIPNPVAKFDQGSMFVIGMPPYQSHDRFRLLNNGSYMIAWPDSSAIHVYDKTDKLEDVINLHIKPRQVKEIEIEYYLRDIPVEYQNDLSERIPKYKPPFLNFWVSNNHILLYTDRSDKGTEMVLLNMKGDPIGKFYLSENDELKQFTGNYLYTIQRSPTGHTIQKYSLGIL